MLKHHVPFQFEERNWAEKRHDFGKQVLPELKLTNEVITGPFTAESTVDAPPCHHIGANMLVSPTIKP